MPTRVVADDDEQIIADLQKDMRRLRSRLATTSPRGGHDAWTAAATPATTYQLTYIPVQGTAEFAINGHEQREGTDYTVDYGTGLVTVSASLASGDKLVARYLVTDWLVARSLPEDTGLAVDSFYLQETDLSSQPTRSASGASGQTATLVNMLAGYSGAFNPPESVTQWPSNLTEVVQVGGAQGQLMAIAEDTSAISAGAWPALTSPAYAQMAMGSTSTIWAGANVTKAGAAATRVGYATGLFNATNHVDLTVPAGVQAGDIMLLLAGGGSIDGLALTLTISSGWTTLASDITGQVQWIFASRVATSADASSTVTVTGNRTASFTFASAGIVAYR